MCVLCLDLSYAERMRLHPLFEQCGGSPDQMDHFAWYHASDTVPVPYGWDVVGTSAGNEVPA